MKKSAVSRLLVLAGVALCLAVYSLAAEESAKNPPPADGPASAADTPDPAAPAPADNGVVSALPGTDGPQVSYQPRFFGSDVPLDSHRLSGYLIAGLYAGAAVVGMIHYDNLLNDRTDSLKWVHVGLVGGGEILYAYNAITGISMIPKDGKDTKMGQLHRTAFIVHAALTVAQLVLGICESSAVERGDRQTVKVLGLAHQIIGIAIPAVELGSGIMTNFPDLLGKD